MIFLNNKTRKEEAAVANAMASLLVANLSDKPVSNETYAHYFGLACEQNKFTPDATSMDRILKLVEVQMSDLNKATAKLATQINKSTDDLIEATRRARK